MAVAYAPTVPIKLKLKQKNKPNPNLWDLLFWLFILVPCIWNIWMLTH